MTQLNYVTFFPPLGQLGGPVEPWVYSVGIDPLDLSAHLGKDILLIAEPFDASTGVELGLYGPIGELIYPAGGSWGWTGGRTTLTITCTTGRSSDNDDSPAATYVPGTLQPFDFGYSLFDGVDPLQRSRPGEGVITLIDPAGEHDGLIGRIWDSTPITIKRGVRGTPFSTWETVGNFRSAWLLYDSDTKQLYLRDLGWQLEGPLHGEVYQGTGGLEGDASAKGKIKPWALGYCFNVEPVLLSAASQIFQFNLSSSSAVRAFRHGGAALTFDADYPDYASLAAATIGSGKYATCLAQSLVRPNITIQKSIKLDVTGDADTVNGHAGPLTRASIARRVATSRGQNRLDDASEIDTVSFNGMESYHSAPVGWYFGTDISKADALDKILAGVLGWWRVRPDGRLNVGWVIDPLTISPAITLPYKSEGMSKLRMVATAVPRAGTYISWQTNYGPEDQSNLAGSVSVADAAVFAQVAQYAASLSPSVSSIYPTSANVTIDEAGFRDQVDAGLEANRQQNIFSAERRRWEFEMEIDPFVDLIGGGLALTGVDGLGLGDLANFLCVGFNAPAGGSPTIALLG